MARGRKLTAFQARLIRNSDIGASKLADQFGISQQTVCQVRKGRESEHCKSYRDVSEHPEPGSYEVADAVQFLQSFPHGLLSGIATSPPYNKAFNGRGKNGAKSNWAASKLMADGYAQHNDSVPEEEYVEQQRAFLEVALEKVGDEGVILYNIGRKIKNLREDSRKKIVEGFPVRQTIIWNRKSSNNQGGKSPTIFPPIYELIYIIAGDGWRLPERWLGDFRKWGDVWTIPFQNHNPHPAPFPIGLAVRMVKTVDGPIADPFAGSGTIGIAAEYIRDSEGVDIPYYLNDHSQAYRQLWEETKAARLAAHKEKMQQ